MRERTSLAGRSEGLEFWLRCAALRAFFARDREVVGLRDGDGEESEEGESLSLAEACSAADGCRGIMSSLASRDGGGCMLNKEKSGSSKACEVFVGAMALHEVEMCCFVRRRSIDKAGASGKASLIAG